MYVNKFLYSIESVRFMKYIYLMVNIDIARATNKRDCYLYCIAFYDCIFHSSCMPCLTLIHQMQVIVLTSKTSLSYIGEASYHLEYERF